MDCRQILVHARDDELRFSDVGVRDVADLKVIGNSNE